MRYFILFLLIFLPNGGHAQSLERVGELRYRRLIDDITDADRSLVYTAEVSGKEVRTGKTIAWVGRVIWRCDGQQVEVILRADSLPLDSATIRWRVDEHEASEPETWKTGASGVSVFASHASADRLTAQAIDGERLVVRVKYPDGSDFDYDFDLQGAEDAISRLACAPGGHTDEAANASLVLGQGTTNAMWGWFNQNRNGEERWALRTENSFLQVLRLSS